MRAVLQEEHAVGDRGRAGVVGDHDDGLAELVDRAAQQGEDLVGRCVESRLPVGSSANSTAGLRDQRPGDGHALLLAARKLGGPMVEAVAQADARDQRREPAAVGRRPAMVSGSVRFSAALSMGSRLNDWKMKPILSRRSLVSWRSFRRVISTPSISTEPLVGCRARRGCA